MLSDLLGALRREGPGDPLPAEKAGSFWKMGGSAGRSIGCTKCSYREGSYEHNYGEGTCKSVYM